MQYGMHRQEILVKYSDLCLGVLEGETPEVVERKPGELSPVPYAEPTWSSPAFKSPYFDESHERLRRAVREFVDVHLTPEALEKEKDGSFISQDMIDKMAENNILAMRLGPGKHLHGRKIMGGVVEGDKFDAFHDMVVSQELTRHLCRGMVETLVYW